MIVNLKERVGEENKIGLITFITQSLICFFHPFFPSEWELSPGGGRSGVVTVNTVSTVMGGGSQDMGQRMKISATTHLIRFPVTLNLTCHL